MKDTTLAKDTLEYLEALVWYLEVHHGRHSMYDKACVLQTRWREEAGKGAA